MGIPRHPAPGLPPFHGEHPPAYYPMSLPPPVEKPLGPMPPQAPPVRNQIKINIKGAPSFSVTSLEAFICYLTEVADLCLSFSSNLPLLELVHYQITEDQVQYVVMLFIG